MTLHVFDVTRNPEVSLDIINLDRIIIIIIGVLSQHNLLRRRIIMDNTVEVIVVDVGQSLQVVLRDDDVVRRRVMIVAAGVGHLVDEQRRINGLGRVGDQTCAWCKRNVKDIRYQDY
jgi:hypothetical protein